MPNEDNFQNVYKGKQPSYSDLRSISIADHNLNKVASNGKATLIEFKNNDIKKLFDQFDSKRLLVIIGHSEFEGGKQVLCLPNRKTIPLDDIYEESSKRDVECVLVTCVSPDLKNSSLDIIAASKACNLLGLMISRNQIQTCEEAVLFLRLAILAEETKNVRITAVATTSAGGTYVVTASPKFRDAELEMLAGTFDIYITNTLKSFKDIYTRKADEYFLTSTKSVSKAYGKSIIKFIGQDEAIENVKFDEDVDTDPPDENNGEYDRIKFYKNNGQAFLHFSSAVNVQREKFRFEDDVKVEFVNGSWDDYKEGKIVEVRIKPKDFERFKQSYAIQLASQIGTVFQNILKQELGASLKNKDNPLKSRMPINCTCETIKYTNNIMTINQNTIENASIDPIVLKLDCSIKIFVSKK